MKQWIIYSKSSKSIHYKASDQCFFLPPIIGRKFVQQQWLYCNVSLPLPNVCSKTIFKNLPLEPTFKFVEIFCYKAKTHPTVHGRSLGDHRARAQMMSRQHQCQHHQAAQGQQTTSQWAPWPTLAAGVYILAPWLYGCIFWHLGNTGVLVCYTCPKMKLLERWTGFK